MYYFLKEIWAIFPLRFLSKYKLKCMHRALSVARSTICCMFRNFSKDKRVKQYHVLHHNSRFVFHLNKNMRFNLSKTYCFGRMHKWTETLRNYQSFLKTTNEWQLSEFLKHKKNIGSRSIIEQLLPWLDLMNFYGDWRTDGWMKQFLL